MFTTANDQMMQIAAAKIDDRIRQADEYRQARQVRAARRGEEPLRHWKFAVRRFHLYRRHA
jgi:hypothetical protein